MWNCVCDKNVARRFTHTFKYVAKRPKCVRHTNGNQSEWEKDDRTTHSKVSLMSKIALETVLIFPLKGVLNVFSPKDDIIKFEKGRIGDNCSRRPSASHISWRCGRNRELQAVATTPKKQKKRCVRKLLVYTGHQNGDNGSLKAI